MRHYEIVMLFHPDQSSQASAMLDRYKKIITDAKGSVHRFEDWGRKQLAYMIGKVHKAHYFIMNVECSTEVLDELKNSFKYNDAIVRHLIMRRKQAITEPTLLLKENTEN